MNALLKSRLILLTALLCGATTLSAQDRQDRTVSVSGTGQVGVPVAFASIELGVESQAETATAAQAATAAKNQALIQLLESRNVQKLETRSIQLFPIYKRTKTEPENRLVGYRSSNIVSFRVEIPRAGEILDAAVKTGANRLQSLSLIAKDEDLAKARERALALAAKDARKKGDIILGALELEFKDIVRIDASQSTAGPVYRGRQVLETAAADSGAVTQIRGSEVNVQARVQMVIRY